MTISPIFAFCVVEKLYMLIRGSSDECLRALSGFYLCYDQFAISQKGPQDTTDEHCTIFYDKDKVTNKSS
ncbi:hypothetical protein JHK87_015990 [Glycine soja]|nr:hypothetical protein JHK87_015990 [Glycine soja]